ncbi:hypothetical protein MMC32_006675 [Xylographa parallela]|nr:hypothetical protein [Xylographa parallela]
MPKRNNKSQRRSKARRQRPTTAPDHLAHCKTGCLPSTCAPGTFGMYFSNPTHQVKNDPHLVDHPFLLLDERFNLSGSDPQTHRACLIVTQSPRGPSLPVRNSRKPAQKLDRAALYQTADGVHVPWPWHKAGTICFDIKMIHTSCLHNLRWKSGKINVPSGLDKKSLEVVESHLTRSMEQAKTATVADKATRRPAEGAPSS